MIRHCISYDDSGAALLIALLALLLFSLIGLFMSLNATTGVEISDNYESQIQATYAALAGLHHARELLRGLALDDLLKGPDGTYDSGPAYLAEAKSYEFRNPLPLLTAQTLDIADPSSAVSGIADDGVISAGFYGGSRGTPLIPVSGIGQLAPNPYGPGTIMTSRYFVKVTDNNGEASEIAGDPDDNPFVDADGVVIARSLGVARTISNMTGPVMRRNSIVIYEARFKRLATWNAASALVVAGNQINAGFSGGFEIAGGRFPGIGTIDTIQGDTIFPDQIIRDAAGGSGQVSGGGEPNPSVRDITSLINSNRDRRLLLDPAYLRDFVFNKAPSMSDAFYNGDQYWTGGSAPNIGAYDSTVPVNAPGQDPKMIVVNGNLQITGGLSGGGLLIVTGNLLISGPFNYNGLILVIGSGSINASGPGIKIEGGLFAMSLTNAGGETGFGIPSITINGDCRLLSNEEIIRMAVGLIPPSQISFREIAGSDL